jgi:hypothetical protein
MSSVGSRHCVLAAGWARSLSSADLTSRPRNFGAKKEGTMHVAVITGGMGAWRVNKYKNARGRIPVGCAFARQ